MAVQSDTIKLTTTRIKLARTHLAGWIKISKDWRNIIQIPTLLSRWYCRVTISNPCHSKISRFGVAIFSIRRDLQQAYLKCRKAIEVTRIEENSCHEQKQCVTCLWAASTYNATELLRLQNFETSLMFPVNILAGSEPTIVCKESSTKRTASLSQMQLADTGTIAAEEDQDCSKHELLSNCWANQLIKSTLHFAHTPKGGVTCTHWSQEMKNAINV